MRISDWSSDVCSSDLTTPRRAASYLRTMGRRGVRRDTRPPRRPTPAGGAMDVVRHRPRRAVLPDVRRLPRPQRDPVRADRGAGRGAAHRSEEHTSELQSLMRISYAVFCLKKKNKTKTKSHDIYITANKNRHKTTADTVTTD